MCRELIHILIVKTSKFMIVVLIIQEAVKAHLIIVAAEVYDQLGLEVTEANLKTHTINQLVTGCEQRGYIERVGNTCKIRMTAAGIKLCNHIEDDGTSYCSKVPS
jgi:predicted transcriptional regulator of viral defense system